MKKICKLLLIICLLLTLTGCEEIKKISHQHIYEVNKTEPTCTEDGYTEYTCECGDTYKDNYEEALGHSYGEWVIVKESTETEKGLKEKECSKCGDKISEDIDKKLLTIIEEIKLESEEAYDVTALELELPSEVFIEYGDNILNIPVEFNTQTFITNQIGTQKLTASIIDDTLLKENNILINNIYIEIDILPYTFSLDDTTNKYMIVKYYGNNASEIIPNTFKNKNVTSIGYRAFENCTSLTNITIPSNVTSIGDWAFENCTSLENVYYEGTIEDWCNISFESYYSNPMYYASHFYIRNSNNEWEEVTEIEIPSTITSIGDYQFYGFENVTNITIPSGVTSISDRTFYNCTSLTNITIPSSVTSIGSSAFNNCTSLTNITIPSNVTSIGYDVFFNCTSLTNITFEEGSKLTSIESSTFYNCQSLTNITIPSSVTSIGYYAFRNCTSLTNITIPNTVTSIGDYAFDIIKNESLENIYYEGTIEDWCNITFSNTYSNPMYYASHFYTRNSNNEWEEVTKIEIPSTLTTIGYQFTGFEKVTSITISSEVTSIGSDAFSSCTSLGNVYYEGTIEDWCSITFKNSNSNPMYYASHFYIRNSNNEWKEVTEIEIPSTIKSIGKYQFYGFNNVTNITIPSSVTSIGSSAFNGCYNLYEVTNNTNLVFTPGPSDYGYIAYYALKVDNKGTVSYKNNATVYEYFITEDGFKFLNHNNNYYLISYTGNFERPVLPATVNGSTYSCQYMDITLKDIELSSDFNSIYDDMFVGCSSLKSIEIPNTVTTIGSFAFVNCTSLENVYYEGTIEDWCNITFSRFDSNPMCYASHFYIRNSNNEWEEVTEIEIPSTITSIGDYQFYGFENVTNITIPSGVTSISDRTFYNCTSLTNITIPSSVTSIGKYAFYNCTSLTNVTISSGVTSIGSWAFYNCKLLTNVIFEEGSKLTSIGKSAFSNCTSLTNIIIPNSVTNIDLLAFDNCTSLTIYCEAASEPSGWDSNWNFSNCPVVWDILNKN